MRTKYALLALPLAAVLLFLMGRITAQDHTKLHAKTADNLSSAMHGEAFAYVKYMLYADHARKSGHKELADLFEKNARTERFEHFAEEAKILGLVGSDEQNLRDAIKGESYEFNHMYPDFSAQASQLGDTAAATRFSEIRQDEGRHRDAFQSALNKLQGKSAHTALTTTLPSAKAPCQTGPCTAE